jgi:glycine amidinotransferase
MRLNSYDEWSPLKEIIVGSGSGYTEHLADLSFDLFFYDNLTQDNRGRPDGYYPRLGARDRSASGTRLAIKQRYVDELNEDVEEMAKTISFLGVVVHRPMRAAGTTGEVTTPAWSAPVLPPLNVRDNTLILGDEIIETPPKLRALLRNPVPQAGLSGVLPCGCSVDGDAATLDDRRLV